MRTIPDGPPSAEKMLDDAESDLGYVQTQLAKQMAILSPRNIEFWGIESGQTIRGQAGDPDIRDNGQFVSNLVQTQYSDRMYGMYKTYLDILEAGGVTSAQQFSFVALPGKFGNWGAMDALDAQWGDSPKMRAIYEWTARK